MSRYERAKYMHQNYRDICTQEYVLPDIGKLPYDWVVNLLNSRSCDTLLVAEELMAFDTGLPADKDKALKLVLMAITQANLAFDNMWEGKQIRLPQPYINSVINCFSKVLTLHPDMNYFVIAVQLFFRFGEIEYVMKLVQEHREVAEVSSTIKKIMAMIYIVSQDYEQATPYVSALIKNPEAATANPWLVPIMAMTCSYKSGDYSASSYVDFSSLKTPENARCSKLDNSIQWVVMPQCNGRTKPTILIACDECYFFEHALAKIYSLYETNCGQLFIHLHLYNPNQSVVAQATRLCKQLPEMNISVTTERIITNTANARIQFICNRFTTADYLFSYFNSPLVIMDADSLFRNSWSSWFEKIPSCDVIICGGGKDPSPFWEEVIGGFVYLGGGELSRRYVHETARFIQHNFLMQNYVMFLDEIALSVCFDLLLVDSPAVFIERMPKVVDITHGEYSLSWTVTANKENQGAYYNYKKQLCEKYSLLPLHGNHNAFRILSQQKKPVWFLQVGAMDGANYDPIFSYVTQYGWQGVLVEPLPDMMERLITNYQKQGGLIFENVAISDCEEIKPLFRVLPETIQKHNLPHWLQGMSTFVEGKLDDYKNFVAQQAVQCVALKQLLDKHNLPSVDVLQIDTEGYDYQIFRQFDFSRYRPAIINIEVVNLNPTELASLEADLVALDYVFYRHSNEDIIALHKDFFFPGMISTDTALNPVSLSGASEDSCTVVE